MLVFFMKNLLFFMACLFAAGSLGCSSHQKPKVAGSLEATPLAQARVFDQNKLIHGGKLLVVPFSAGKNVVASDQLDHVSLMLVKGIADVMGSSGKPFKILVEQDAQSADFVIKGRIVQMEEKKLFHKPWQKKIRKFSLAVERSVPGVETEEVLAKFS